ncbi:MAG TPA: LPS-assembly protein LptD [Acidovorax defluvii]|nr:MULTISPECIES: LPS-assembly protein LptD [unclassified Acidovorax]HQS19880.1 LPS-assembly protein LptD [Acidovorax defluvii]HQS62323.1 LPS-assembly protein LptD [Acidovorax defluvii]HQT15970.1 LPS-assembly protein LptD [Acidovorax defluvii]HQT48449.1 LPS-assembly protein LptD [Acidovorax defluvii]
MALAWCGVPLVALAQADAQSAWDAPPALRRSPQLQETLPAEVRPQLPVFVSGDRITGQPDVKAVIDGNAELRRGDTVIRADRLEYTVPDDLAQAQGQVHINRAGNTYDGSELALHVDAFKGFFSDARYRFLQTGAHGDATRVDFLDRDRAVVHNATYTTCQRDDSASWEPDWVLRAQSIRLDNVEEVGTAEGAVLEFKGVSVLPIPHITFPLSDKRKSGLLPPTVGLDSRNGLEYIQPYYWNIAPNRDATLRGAIMAKRGIEVGGEFRYLENDYQGQVDATLMPTDSQRDRMRWGYSAQHQGQISTPVGGLGLNLNLNRVSDDNYWRDFGRAALALRQRLLPSDASLSWAAGDMSAQVRTLKWQALQDVASPIVPPYNLMPQLLWRYTPQDLGRGIDFSMSADTTRFEADRAIPNPADGQRSYVQAQLSRPFLSPGGFVIPKLQLHATQYQFDSPLRTGERSASRTLPTFSLDSGLVFEREARLLGRAFTQTLEPRAFYTYTPFRDQSHLPVYDTGATDFNFGTIYTENPYVGNDRLADNNLLTLGVTTRFLDPQTGAEAVRLGIAQRLRFSDQDVTLPGGAPVSERLSDVLLGAGINWTPQWGFDSTVQYNPKTQRSIRSTVAARYSPGDYRTVSAVYRLQRGASEQIDVGWQWPLAALWGGQGADSGPERAQGQGKGSGRWYTVGRLNYSLQDRKLVDTVVGFEYDSCCWIGRVVLERLQSSVTTSNTRLLFQIEFVGFSRLSLGASPLETLRRNVPRYQYLREQVSTPSRFSNYD